MMPITFTDGTFQIRTAHTSLQFGPDTHGILQHFWYGPDTGQDMSYLQIYPDVGFSGQLYDAGDVRTDSCDTKLQEYPTAGTGDYRVPAAIASFPLDLRYVTYRILSGRAPLPGLPYAKGADETLEVVLQDVTGQLEVVLSYVVFVQEDVIARHVTFKNIGTVPIQLEKAASLVLNWGPASLDLLHFHGRHLKERILERMSVPHGITEISSLRGTSSHQHNPAVIVAEQNTGETFGNCAGCMFLYSGSYAIQVEKDQLDQTRLVMGLHPDQFSWQLEPGKTFVTPEAVFSFSQEGLGALSRNFHRFLRNHILPACSYHPVLLNSWEAAYFDVDKDTILQLAQGAKSLGADLLVLDDGWFGIRDNDHSGLGDWTPNQEKLGGTLSSLISQVQALGLDFGIWIEPEMVSEDSDLYRAHPDWVLQTPGIPPVRSRYQLVLDMGHPEVRDQLYQQISALLGEHSIRYVKWDMNRSLCVPRGETAHRYMLGVYELLDRLTSAFPEVLFEGCSGGGGRFDGGMLFYTPQIWTSDDTDPRQRTLIQYGTSFFYPPQVMGSHVSASPNHQTGRTSSLEARAICAMAGTYGYELDPALFGEDEKKALRTLTEQFHSIQPLVLEGDYYRLTDPFHSGMAFWMFVAPDKSQAVVQGLWFDPEPNQLLPRVQLAGLDPKAWYQAEGKRYTGAALMQGGIVLPKPSGPDFPVMIVLTRTPVL